jgi:hypothetical protein
MPAIFHGSSAVEWFGVDSPKFISSTPSSMLSPATFDSVLVSKLDESVVMPVDLIIWSSDNRELFHDRIFTVRKIIQPADLAPGLYRITMTNEHGLVHEGYYSKAQ